MRKYIFTYFILMMLPVALFGQALRGSYFFDSSIQRVKMNPAFAPKTNYFTLPVLGDLSLNVNSNIGVSNFLFPKNGELYTYLNQNVSSAEFQALLPAQPRIQMAFDTDLLGAGFYVGPKGYVTFDIAERMNLSMNVPSDLFMFLKEGMAKDTYNFKNFTIYQDAYVQISGGYRRDLSDVVPGLAVGAKLKFLVGLDRIDMKINNAQIYMSQDKWELNTDAEGTIYGTWLDFVPAAQEGELPKVEMDFSKLAPAGYGVAVDLGAEYKLKLDNPVIDGVNFSASVVDLGTIFYSENGTIKLQSKGSAAFEGLKDINAQFDIDQSLKKISADFMALANLQEVQGAKGGSGALTPKAYVGVEAPMLNNLMSVGLLYSYMYGISDITASYNLKVKDIFNVGVNYSFMNTAKTLGFILEFVPRNGVAIFLGTDYMNMSYIPQGLPVDKVIMNAKLGIQATFGSKFCKREKKN
ncbi:MAG: hypothetical protein IKW65_07450 [Bacteroidales bacterium]|nr:hypothetical protein [Bacteroidales bacterium]